MEPSQIDSGKLLRRIAEAECDLAGSTFFTGAIDKILPVLRQANIQQIICLGLGKLAECNISRHQLAFVRCLQRSLDFEGKIRYFDPVFTQQEKDILQLLEGIVLEENLEGKYIAGQNTLFFLPHCPKQISNNLLWKNWNLDQLGRVYLICNSFEQIITNSPERFLQNNARFILQIAKHTIEIPIENNFKFTDIFNDTSFHYFDSTSLQSESFEFWEATEPTYTEEDLELITKKVTTRLTLTENGLEDDAQTAD